METNELNSMNMPFFGALHAIGQREFDDHNYFNTGTLFWSLTRLFGCYERVMFAVNLPREKRPFLDADIESFLIRFRIVLNDIAYVVWQLFPTNTRNLNGPRGGTHPKNREISFFTLAKHIRKTPLVNTSLAEVFEDALSWANRLKEDRDNVVHYKSQVVVFGDIPSSFALVNAAGTERKDPNCESNSRLLLEPVEDFINDQMLSLHIFLNSHLTDSITEICKEFGYKHAEENESFWNPTMTCIGLESFRKRNSINI